MLSAGLCPAGWHVAEHRLPHRWPQPPGRHSSSTLRGAQLPAVRARSRLPCVTSSMTHASKQPPKLARVGVKVIALAAPDPGRYRAGLDRICRVEDVTLVNDHAQVNMFMRCLQIPASPRT